MEGRGFDYFGFHTEAFGNLGLEHDLAPESCFAVVVVVVNLVAVGIMFVVFVMIVVVIVIVLRVFGICFTTPQHCQGTANYWK